MSQSNSNQPFYCGVQCVVFGQGSRASSPRKVLLGRRFRTAGDGQWALPGGHVEWNESPIVTARRELREETGLLGQSAKLGATFFTYSTKIPYAHVSVLFETVQGTPRIVDGEHFSELRYFRLDNLPRPLFEPSRLALSGLRDGPINAMFGGEGGASFLKVDMALLDTHDQRNRAYTALLLCDHSQSNVIATWGKRQYRGRQVQRSTFPSLDQGIRKFEESIRRRIQQEYYVTGVSGDLSVDRVLEMLPDAGDLQVVSKALIRRLLRDDEFRRLFSQDVYLYLPGVGYPIDPNEGYQEALFDI
jgi:8-oxo-dGTP diphosphatase